jgi:hypothetical protein
MSVMLDCMSAPFVPCRRNRNQILTVATTVARNANETIVTPMVGSGGVCVWQESGFSRREDVFTLDLLYKEIL